MSQEILDNFDEEPPLKAYEKAIDFLQGIKLKNRTALILLFSFGSYAIVEFKDNKVFEAATAFGVWIAMAILAMLAGFMIKYLLVAINYLIEKTSGKKSQKLDELDYVSISLVVSGLMLLSLFVLAIFVD